MNISNIKVFLKVAEVLSFTKAADQLFISQPALSRQIASMEEEMGLTLFKRNNKNVTLTESGLIVFNGLREILWLYDDMIQTASIVEEGCKGKITIASFAGQQITRALLPVVDDFKKKYEEIEIDFRACDLAGLRQLLFTNRVDFAFGLEPSFDYLSDLAYSTIGNVKMCLAMRKDHPLCQTGIEGLRLIDFKDDTFITHSDETGARESLLKLLAEFGISAKTIQASELATVYLLAEAGKGVAALDESSIYALSPFLKFVPLPELGYFNQVIAWKKDVSDPCALKFIEHIKQYSE